MSESLEEIIKKHALKNALDYGKASQSAVVGKVIAEYPDAKKDMKATMQKINEVISLVNSLSREEIEGEIKKYSFAEKQKEEKKGFNIPNAIEGKVVTRFPPEPSGYPHIGHAKAAFFDYEIARQYNGKMVLRFDDTNPEKESQKYVDAIKEGLKWLGIKWDKETYTSDNLEKIYAYAEKLIFDGNAYVCTCSQEAISRSRIECTPCPCRMLLKEENFKRWKRMLDGEYKEGTAILRFKGDLASQNTVMRDPSLARIVNASHFRQGNKYNVWPNYDLAVCIMDALEGITHPLRSKEYELRDELYFTLLERLGLPQPTMISISRLQIKNIPVSKRILRQLVDEKKVSGWDDPRLPTLMGLKRRGILPEAIKQFVLSFGLSKVESEPTLEKLLVENKKLLDPISKRYFFVPDPVELEIRNAKPQKVRLRLHPHANIGYREITVRKKVFISKSDADQLKEGESFRLKDLYNIKLVKKEKRLIGEWAGTELLKKKIQWVSDEYVPCEIMIPKDLFDEQGNYNEKSLELVKGYCEKNCEGLNEGEIIQFERFGFCRLDKIGKTLSFIYLS